MLATALATNFFRQAVAHLERLVSLIEYDRSFADVTLVDRVGTKWTLLPSILFFEVKVLEKARVAEKMAALGNTRCDHEARRLHADGTLGFLM